MIAPWFNQINTFLWGGITQHGDQVGNLCADLNGMGGGAKAFRDGEDAVSPLFCAMADTAEQEVMEEEVPFMQLVAKRLVRDNQGFGKYRGGMGYEMIVAAEGTPLWGFMTVTSGAKFSSITGMFGGYGSNTYPLARVKGVNVYDVIRENPEQFDLSIEKVMNEQPFEGGQYMTSHMGLQFDIAKDGELYMISQGTGGGYGDALERDPAAVIADLELDRISRQGRTRDLRRRIRPGHPGHRRGSHQSHAGTAAPGPPQARQAVQRVRQGVRQARTPERPAVLRVVGR